MTSARMVSIHRHENTRWQCDCVCGWKSNARMRFARQDAARHAATFHLRVCTLLHP